MKDKIITKDKKDIFLINEQDLELNEIVSVNTLINGDCLNVMSKIKKKSIDIILADLPYGITKNKWDEIIPFNDYIIINKKIFYLNEWLLYAYKSLPNLSYSEALKYFNDNKQIGLWTHYERIIKDNGVILLFSQYPFDKKLALSNEKMFRYEWIWEKTTATGFLNSKKMPLKAHENVLVFYKKLPYYNPQKTTGHIRKVSKIEHKRNSKKTENYGEHEFVSYDSTERYPRSVIKYSTDKQKSAIHSTQKPIELLKYLIKTYSPDNSDYIVLDNCFGSGSTIKSCIELNRLFIGIEKDKDIFNKAIEYIKK